ncbi:autotransporter outer membrane beta-barrel domain-containing protein [Ferruginibacter sp.]
MKSLLVFIISIVLLVAKSSSQNVGVNTPTPEATLDVNGDLILRTTEITVADGITIALDINTTRFSYYRLTGPTADFTIAGIAAGNDGRLLTLFNRTGFNMQINNEDVNAAVTDMIVTGTNADITIINKGIVNLQYDATEQKWIVKSSSKGSVAGGGGFWDASGNNISNNNTGNVGIGTTSPINKLTVETDNNSYGITHRSIQGNILSTRIGGTTAGIGTFSPTDMRIFSGSLSRMIISQATGGVFIGTDNPAVGTKLTVQTLNNSDGISHIGENGNVLSTRIGGTSAGIGTFSPTNMRIFSGGFSRIFVSEATGNVGIGVPDDNPVFKLDVADRMRIRSGTGGSTAGVWLNNPANTAAIGFMGIADAVTTGFWGNVSGWGLIMNTNTGNVGIGTLNPTYKLSVNGDIRTKEVVVETGWADYVFDKKYKLAPLEDVEKFIQQNKHLPNIPSAKEVAEKGLHVGDVQKRMMEKIEELTLYMIELKKEIEALKKK